jgi:hypothetical protein
MSEMIKTTNEAMEIDDLLGALREIRASGGWGELSVKVQGGDICLIEVNTKRKPSGIKKTRAAESGENSRL